MMTLKEMFAFNEEIENIFADVVDTGIDQKALAAIKLNVDKIRDQDAGLQPIDKEVIQMLGDVLVDADKEPNATAMAVMATKIEDIYEELFTLYEREEKFHDENESKGVASKTPIWNSISIISRSIRSLIYYAPRVTSLSFKREMQRLINAAKRLEEFRTHKYRFCVTTSGLKKYVDLLPESEVSVVHRFSDTEAPSGPEHIGPLAIEPGDLKSFGELISELSKLS